MGNGSLLRLIQWHKSPDVYSSFLSLDYRALKIKERVTRKSTSSVLHRSERRFGVLMDTGGLIRKLSKFLAPLADGVLGELCRNHSIAYVDGLRSGATWATRSM